ncbi:MAG: hypothetical protein PHH85_11275 [Candidatus Methanoperedens sp.]|nr:hypothetical protein [Candidatus Methanoperedens sp.]
MNPYILSITGVSIRVSGTATILATLTAIPLACVTFLKAFEKVFYTYQPFFS